MRRVLVACGCLVSMFCCLGCEGEVIDLRGKNGAPAMQHENALAVYESQLSVGTGAHPDTLHLLISDPGRDCSDPFLATPLVDDPECLLDIWQIHVVIQPHLQYPNAVTTITSESKNADFFAQIGGGTPYACTAGLGSYAKGSVTIKHIDDSTMDVELGHPESFGVAGVDDGPLLPDPASSYQAKICP